MVRSLYTCIAYYRIRLMSILEISILFIFLLNVSYIFYFFVY